MAPIFLAIPFLGLLTAIELPAPGIYAYSGEFTLRQKRVTEAVPTNTESGLARVKALRAEGFACQGAGVELVRCSAFRPVTAEDEAVVRESVRQRLSGATLELGAASGEPSLVSKGADYEEWSVPQAGNFRGVAFDAYTYQHLVPHGVHKLKFGREGVVREGKGFLYMLDVQKQPSRLLLISYLVAAKLK